MKSFRRVAAVVTLAAASLLSLAGCTDWERTTYETLAISQSIIDTAQDEYTVGTIPQTTCANTIINGAKNVQSLAVHEFAHYKQLKDAKADTEASTALISQYILELPELVTQVKTLTADPTASCGGAK